MSSRNLSSSNLNFSVLTLSMSLRYFGNELYNRDLNTVIAFYWRDCAGFLFVWYWITHCRGGRGASVSACAGLTNQLLSCWVDPRIAWIKHWHSNCRRPVDGGEGIPHHSLYCLLVQKSPIWGAWLASSYLWAYRISLSVIKFIVFHVLDIFWFLLCAPLCHQYLAPYARVTFEI